MTRALARQLTLMVARGLVLIDSAPREDHWRGPVDSGVIYAKAGALFRSADSGTTPAYPGATAPDNAGSPWIERAEAAGTHNFATALEAYQAMPLRG